MTRATQSKTGEGCRPGTPSAVPCAPSRPNKPPAPSTRRPEPLRAGRLRRVHWNIMAKKMLIDATHAEETRVVVVDGNKVEEFDFETVNKRQLAGNIYLAKVTRVEPSLQAAFVDYGGNRHGFLAFAEIHPDYYQIPVADRKALLEEERAMARAEEEEDNRRVAPPRAASGRPGPRRSKSDDAVGRGRPSGMDVVDLGEDDAAMARCCRPRRWQRIDDRRTIMGTTTRTTTITTNGNRRRRGEGERLPRDGPRQRHRRRDRSRSPKRTWPRKSASRASRAPGATRSRKWSRSGRSCWCRSSRKSAATRARR